MAMQSRSSSIQRLVNTITGSGYHFDIYHRPGRSFTAEEKIRLRDELRELGELALPSVPYYQCFSASENAFDDKVLILAREGGPNGGLVAFVSCILIEVANVGTILHTGLTCIHPSKQRQGLQRILHGRLWTLLCREYPKGIWYTNSACSPCGLVGMFEVTKRVFPSPKMTKPSETHLMIADAFSTMHRAKVDIRDETVFDKERFVFDCKTEGVWYKDPYDRRYHHKNKEVNNFYVEYLAHVPGSEILQIGYMDWSIHLPIFGFSMYVGHLATWHTIINSVCIPLSKASSLWQSMAQVWNKTVGSAFGIVQFRGSLRANKEL